MNLAIVVGLLTLAVPTTASACEPIWPLAQLLIGSSAAGPIYLTRSLFWLAVAVAIKCIAFVCFEKRLPWGKAVMFMFFANIVSTIPGMLVTGFAASGTEVGVLLALPVVFALGWMLRRRTMRLPSSAKRPRISDSIALVAFVAFFIVSIVLYGFAQVALAGHHYGNYWLLKFFFVTLVACSGIVISALLEESVIADLSKGFAASRSYYTSVFRANYVTLAMILMVAGLKTLPERLRSPHFLSWLRDSILGLVGLS